MVSNKTLLVPLDFMACDEAAFNHAVRLAQHVKASLDLLHVHTPNHPDPDLLSDGDRIRFEHMVEIWNRYPDRWAQKIERVQEEQGLTVRMFEVEGVTPDKAILRYAEDEDIGLIVMGTHGRTGMDRLVMGSVAEEVVRHAPCPVFVVHDGDAEHHAKIRRILVPVDFSEYSGPALRQAGRLADLYDAQIDVLHVVREFGFPKVYGVHSMPFTLGEVKDRSHEAMQSMIKQTGCEARVNALHVRIGYPSLDILDFAEEQDTDLIVITTHGRTGLSHVMMGSVAEKVVRLAPCPVVTYRVPAKK